MPAQVIRQKFFDEFTGTGSTGSDFLIGYPGDKITAVTDVQVKWSAEDIDVTISATNGTITRNDYGNFIADGFHAGDTFDLLGCGSNNGSYTISVIETDKITISGSFSVNGEHDNAYLYGTNAITATDFYFNLIENGAADDFTSLVDTATIQKYIARNVSATGSTKSFTIGTNSKGWVLDGDGMGAQIIGTGWSNYTQSFRITHTFIITPVALYSQLTNLQNGIPPAPDYYADNKCLKYLFRLDAKTNAIDPNVAHTVTYSKEGNTGWFDEFLNGEDKTYSVANLRYVVSGTDEDEAHYCDDTTVTFNVTSANGTFTTGTTGVLHAIYIPSDRSDYTNTTTKFRENFAYDRVFLTAGAAAKNGINAGVGGYRQIANATITYSSPYSITVSFTMSLASALQTRLSGKAESDRNYAIIFTAQSPSVSAPLSTDRNALLVDVNSYGCDNDDPTLWNASTGTTFFNLLGNDYGQEVNGLAGDDVLAVTPFRVKNVDGAKLTELGITIQAQHATEDDFDLETWSLDTSGWCLDDGVQEISHTEPKGYRLPANHANNNITVSRYSALDNAEYAGYRFYYPFKLRWETWRRLEGANCDFGEATQNWYTIDSKSGWSIKFIVNASVLNSEGYTTDFTHSCNLNVYSTEATGNTGFSCIIKTFDTTGTYELSKNMNGGCPIFFEENTLVRAYFYGTFDPATTYYAILYLDADPVGGVTFVESIATSTSVRSSDGKSPWVGPTTVTVADFTAGATERICSAIIDFTKLQPGITNYAIRARIGILY